MQSFCVLEFFDYFDSVGYRTLAMLKKDLVLLLGSKDYPFIYQQTKDSLNLRGTAELILALCKYNKERAASIVEMITTAVCKLQPEVITSINLLRFLLIQ